MKFLVIYLFVVFCFALAAAISGCKTIPVSPSQTGPEATPAAPPPVPTPPTTGEEVDSIIVLQWETGHPERKAWTAEVVRLLKGNLDSFNKASDRSSYCAKYDGLNYTNRIKVWATMVVEIARYESAFNPSARYAEKFGWDSLGLFMFSYEDKSFISWCVFDKSKLSLFDPINNIRCAIPEMVALANKDGVVASGSGSSDARGLSRYWSTMYQGPIKTKIRAATNALPFCS